MDFQTILYEVDAEGVAIITLNRPKKLNALNATVLEELDAAIRQARADRAVKGVIITGAGEKSFAAGADIQQFTELDALTAHRFALRGQAVFNRIEEMPKVVIAAVNGYALGGGCELARLVGRGIATELILTGEHISAQRAYEIGLVNRVTPAGELLATARKAVLTIGSKAPIAVSLALDALRHSDLPLKQGLRLEAALFGHTAATEDNRDRVYYCKSAKSLNTYPQERESGKKNPASGYPFQGVSGQPC